MSKIGLTNGLGRSREPHLSDRLSLTEYTWIKDETAKYHDGIGFVGEQSEKEHTQLPS